MHQAHFKSIIFRAPFAPTAWFSFWVVSLIIRSVLIQTIECSFQFFSYRPSVNNMPIPRRIFMVATSWKRFTRWRSTKFNTDYKYSTYFGLLDHVQDWREQYFTSIINCIIKFPSALIAFWIRSTEAETGLTLKISVELSYYLPSSLYYNGFISLTHSHIKILGNRQKKKTKSKTSKCFYPSVGENIDKCYPL